MCIFLFYMKNNAYLCTEIETNLTHKHNNKKQHAKYQKF